ncbi:MAG: hypothetical protein QXH20_00375 [Candidatus Bathyarchaeia archaeon]
MTAEQIQLPPFSIEIDGVTFTIHEVTKTPTRTNETLYCVSVSFTYKDVKSKIIPFICKNIEDLKNKLKIEASKIKWTELVYGVTELRRQVS